jgi:hypothetical protein
VTAAEWWPWAAFALLGAYHGINPGMGWLFAVARGLQDRRRGTVVASIVPLALGHEISVVAVVIAVALTQAFVPPYFVRLVAALALVALGIFTLLRPRAAHARGFGMRIGALGLSLWAFLMASAHGAGLMLAPVLLGLPVSGHFADLRQLSLVALAAAAVHLVALLVVMTATSVLVYEKVGLRILRRGWLNLDLVWSGVLLVSGAVTLFTVDPALVTTNL